MSSAILYLAIVAIWAGVLIPRWLRRDSSTARGEAGADATPSPSDAIADEPGSSRGGEDAQARPASPSATSRSAPPRTRSRAPARDLERKRVLAARKRLLWMLVALGIGSAGLTVMGMAAWWVVVPPSIMLFGYLGLLRAAAKADAERRELTARRELARRERARRDLARTRQARPAGRPVPALSAEIIDLPSPADAPENREDLYDQYADAKLRAVGDLSRRRGRPERRRGPDRGRAIVLLR